MKNHSVLSFKNLLINKLAREFNIVSNNKVQLTWHVSAVYRVSDLKNC